jgi:hypothetical protein
VSALRGARESRDADALADALLNPRERSYSMAELFDTLDRTGYAFGRWYTQAPYLPTCGAISKTPHCRRLMSLPARDQYAALELWRGTLATHSLIVHRNDDCPRRDEARDSSVPVRRPYTLCVEDRVPPGAVAVLLNRSHPQSDLILPISGREKRIFDAIGDERSVGDIARKIEMPLADVAVFANTLERYDQIVFDNSKLASSESAV